MPASTVAVEFVVTSVELVRGAEIDIGGIVVTVQGLQTLRLPDGGLEVRAPVWRHPRMARWLPGVLVPRELQQAIADEVLREVARLA